jgi:hypothetical protein
MAGVVRSSSRAVAEKLPDLTNALKKAISDGADMGLDIGVRLLNQSKQCFNSIDFDRDLQGLKFDFASASNFHVLNRQPGP